MVKKRSLAGNWGVGVFVIALVTTFVAFCSPSWLVSDYRITGAKLDKIGLWTHCFRYIIVILLLATLNITAVYKRVFFYINVEVYEILLISIIRHSLAVDGSTILLPLATTRLEGTCVHVSIFNNVINKIAKLTQIGFSY